MASSHQAVAAAVAAGRADWGVCIANCARGLEFEFLAEERFDFAIPADRRERAAVRAFLREGPVRASDEKMEYWNGGYALLAGIVARAEIMDTIEVLNENAAWGCYDADLEHPFTTGSGLAHLVSGVGSGIWRISSSPRYGPFASTHQARESVPMANPSAVSETGYRSTDPFSKSTS